MVPNMQLVRDVCGEGGLNSKILDEKGNFLSVELDKKYFFAYTTTPFNREDTQHVCNDKSLIQELVSPKIRMPKTKKYLRPDLDPAWHDKIEFVSEIDIASDIEKNFTFPLILKMNAGSLSRNVFKCDSPESVLIAINSIFKEDWALLAQELIDKAEEFRVMVVNNSVELAYTKGCKEFFNGESGVLEEIKGFLKPIRECLELGWAGLDLIRDKEERWWLVEINTRPSFIAAVREGKKEEVKALYKKAFQNLSF